MNNKIQLGSVLGIGFFVLFAFVWLNPIFIVQPGQRAIIFNSITGLKSHIYGEGLHFKTPFVDIVEEYNVRKRKKTIPPTNSASKDLQNVQIELSFLFNPMPSKLIDIRQTLGRESEYITQVFPSIPKEVIKAVIAKYTAEEIITRRDDVSIQIKQDLIKRMAENKIVISEVAISDIVFSPKFAEAIELKQVAQQDLLTAKFQKQADITRAQGQAEAARIINNATLNSPAYVELQRIEAQKDIASTLSKSDNITYLPSNMVMMADVFNKKN